jgi:hypothetical protein
MHSVSTIDPLTVLVVEDPVLAERFASQFAPTQVLQAHSVPDAMESIMFFRPEVVLLAGPRQEALYAALREEGSDRVYVTQKGFESLGASLQGLRWLVHQSKARRAG